MYIMRPLFYIPLLFLLSACSKQDEPEKEREPRSIVVIEREIEVNGKISTVFSIHLPGSTYGLTLTKGDEFDFSVYNASTFPTSLHWHGLILPNSEDGVACVTQPPIAPGTLYPYHFKLLQAGTFWMHSHFGLQNQQLLSAPLIIKDPNEADAHQDVVMFLADFTFQNPQRVLDGLRTMKSKKTQDINDVSYDAFLTNSHTLSNPSFIKVEPGNTIRLRIIDGATSTNFFVDLGALKGKAIAVDGNGIRALSGSRFEIAVAQRLDLLIDIPKGEGAYPIFAQGEGTTMLTGLVLMTPHAKPPALSEQSSIKARAFNYEQEKRLTAESSLIPKPVDRTLTVELGGDMSKYVWTLNGEAWPNATPLMVKQGERVEMIFNNKTRMSHPMHLHGHVFQVTEIAGQPLSGAMRDTILVLPQSTVKVQFDADNPGVWPLHCHNFYHEVAGMMTTLLYEDYDAPKLNRALCEQCGCINN